MKIDLEKKSKELKELVGRFETHMFLGDLSAMMLFISMGKPSPSLNGLSSPLRQLYYLGALNLTSKNPNTDLVPQYTQEEWEKMKTLLIEIEKGYDQFFYPETEEEIDEDWRHRRMVAMPTFLSYFNQGPLNYEEQIIERVKTYFTPFDDKIEKHFGIKVQDFIDIYNYLDSLPNKFLQEKINKKEGQQNWQEFAETMIRKGLRPDEWNAHLPDHFKNLFSLVYDKGQISRFTKSDIDSKFNPTMAESFLNALVCERKESNFLYYTENNILQLQPIFKVDDEYQCFEIKQIIHSIYSILFNFCTKNKNTGDKFYKIRGDKFEDKVERVFQDFFDNKATVFKGFYTQDGNEQDLLILKDNLALIIEAKASKRKEPRRDPEKAYPLILKNFDEVIQKGYDQSFRVKSKFIDNEIIKIYKDQNLKKLVTEIRPKKYFHVFSLVVTLERFGQIQTDLQELLEIWDDDTFPWSICIDDLEVFLMTLKKKKNKKKGISLIRFLHMREKMHGKTICADELEICGAFLESKISYQKVTSTEIIAFTPGMAEVFDAHYQKGGLGFKEEKNMHYKTSDNYMKIGR